MSENNFTRKYYLEMWNSILSSYQWWGHDLITLLNSIGETNPIVFELFYKIYRLQEGNIYVKRKFKNTDTFYKKLDSLIPDSDGVYTKLRVTALKKENNKLEIQENVYMRRYDYLIAILCFVEEFASFTVRNQKNVSSKRNILSAHSDNIDFIVQRNVKLNITSIRIIIPCELCIEYSVSVNPISNK